MLRLMLAITYKDLVLSLARGSGPVQALLLGFVLIFVFSLAQGVGEQISPQSAAAVFWISSMFCQVLVFNHLYALEEVNNSRLGLLLSPVPCQTIWLGKALAALFLLCCVQMILFPATLIFLAQQVVTQDVGQALAIIVLVDLGMCALGSLLGALAQGQAVRESLLSIILFPLLMPLLLAGIAVLSQTFGQTTSDVGRWFSVTAAFDAIFGGAGLILFGFVYNGED